MKGKSVAVFYLYILPKYIYMHVKSPNPVGI